MGAKAALSLAGVVASVHRCSFLTWLLLGVTLSVLSTTNGLGYGEESQNPECVGREFSYGVQM